MQLQFRTMEVALNNELLEGEELLWSGRPLEGGKSVISSPARVFLGLSLVYGGLGLLLLLLSLILGLAISDLVASGGILGLVIPGVVFLLLGVLFFFLRRVASHAPKATTYAITNRRALILRGGRSIRVTSCDIHSIKQVQRFEQADGSGDLIFSDAFSGYAGVYNSRTSYNTTYSLGRQNAFVAIPNVRQAEQKLLGVMGKV